MFLNHRHVLYKSLCRRGLTTDAATDTTQQAFLIASERLDDIQPGRERAFLFGVAFRLTRSAGRRGARYQLEANMDLRESPEAIATAVSDRLTALQLMNRLLAKLDSDLADALVLFEAHDLSTPEVARELGIPEGTAASRHWRALQKSKAALAHLTRQIPVPPAAAAGGGANRRKR
jgi:RNA polymerase sigma-70 factor (ECF subfamily)